MYTQQTRSITTSQHSQRIVPAPRNASGTQRRVSALREGARVRRRGFYLGTDIENQLRVYVARRHLATHLHLLGPTGSGKSRLLLWLYQLLCSTGRPIILVDFKGGLYRMCRDWALTHGYTKRVVLFDLSAPVIPGYNPLRENGLRIDLQSQWASEGVKSAWGQATFDATPQLARMLYLCLYVARALTISLVEGLDVLRPSPTLRHQALARIHDPFVHDALLAFDKLNDRRKEELAASTLARLEAFCRDEIVRTVICSPQSLDLETVLTERRILLLNFAKYQPLLPDPLKLLARMFTSDLLAHIYKGHGEGKFDEDHPVYFLCDEVQNMATRQLADALDEGRGIGLHCTIAHQHLSQLADEDQSGYLLHSVMNDARTKIVFGDLATEDLEVLAKNVMLDRYDPWRLKDEMTSPVFVPVESSRKSVGRTRSGSQGKSKAISQSQSDGTSQSETEGESCGESSSIQETSGTIHTVSQGRSHSRGRGRVASRGGSRTDLESQSAMAGRGTAHGTHAAHGMSEMAASSESTAYVYDDPAGGLTLSPQMTTSAHQTSGMTTNDIAGMSDSISEFSSAGSSSGTAETASWADAETLIEVEADTISEGEGIMASTGRSQGTSHEHSSSVTHGSDQSITHGVTEGTSEETGWSESETIAPFHEYHREEITSSRTFLTPEEQTLLAIQQMKELPAATFILKVPSRQAMVIRAPFVDEPKVTKRVLEQGLQRVHSLPFYTSLQQPQAPVIDIEARTLPAAEMKRELPPHSPALYNDCEPETFRHRRRVERQEK